MSMMSGMLQLIFPRTGSISRHGWQSHQALPHTPLAELRRDREQSSCLFPSSPQALEVHIAWPGRSLHHLYRRPHPAYTLSRHWRLPLARPSAQPEHRLGPGIDGCRVGF